MAPRGPQKGQKSILMGSLVVLDPNASPKKISSIFGTGCHKACTCPLNGAFSKIACLKTYRHDYFRKQENETGYFCGMTLTILCKTPLLVPFDSVCAFMTTK